MADDVVEADGATPTLRQLADREPMRASVSSHIASVLRDAIVTNVVKGGSQLRQSKLAADFGVSVIPVREALRQLAAEGFIVIEHNRGAVVARISVAEIRELFDLRVTLEPLLLSAALPRMTAADLDQAEQHQEALEKEEDTGRWGQWNWKFHEALYKPAGRPRTLAIAENINGHVDRVLRLQMSLVDGKRKSRREHGALLEACREGRLPTCLSLLTQHIRGVEAIILDYASDHDLDG